MLKSYEIYKAKLRSKSQAESSSIESVTACTSENNAKGELPFLNNQMEFDDPEDPINGLCFIDKYIPEEILFHILSYVDPKEILKCSLVCRKWNKLTKSYSLWATIYNRKYNKKPKHLPWYLYYCLLSTNYFDSNLLPTGNGQDQLNYWKIKQNEGTIRGAQIRAGYLPNDVLQRKKISGFDVAYGTSNKIQEIRLGQSKLFRYILDSYKPHIHISEWAAKRRFVPACIYTLICGLRKNLLSDVSTKLIIGQFFIKGEGEQWKKIETTITDYPEGIEAITFGHETGRLGKMDGSFITFLFDSIEELPVDEHGNIIPKKFKKMNFVTNATCVGKC